MSGAPETPQPPPGPTSPRPKARTSRACSSCNRSKVRCDGSQPCQRCKSLRIAEQCEYLPSMRGKTRRKRKDTAVAETPVAATEDQDSRPLPDPVRETEPPSKRPRRVSAVGGTQKAEYALWHKSSALARYGPRNSAIWGEEDAASPEATEPAPPAGVSPMSVMSGSHSQRSTEGRMPGEGLTTLPLPGDMHNPLAVLAQASATAEDIAEDNGSVEEKSERYPRRREAPPDTASSQTGERDREGGGYYAPLDRVLKDEAPHIMSLINVHEAQTLFSLYQKHLHPHLPVLDISHSAPSAVARRNNFLFNAICCVAARTFNVVLWERLKDFARYEMERIPKEKSIDVVQGHLIYSTWNLIRPNNFEEDMTWLRVGLATRTAIDINLHRVALIRQAREGLPSWMLRSIARTWLMAYVLDRTLSAQLGKPASIRGESGVDVYVKILTDSPDSADFGIDRRPSRDDVLVASLAEWTQLLSRAMESFRAETTTDSRASAFPGPDLVQVFRKQFRQWRECAEAAAKRCARTRNDNDDMAIMLGMLRLYDNYARLVVQSFGLERALERQSITLSAEFAEYQLATVRLLESFADDLSAPNLTRGCPDLVFTVVTYGAVSLLQSLEPRLARLDPSPDRNAVLSLARAAADMLARAAMTPDHLPASQSVFLSRLIQVRSRPPRHRSSEHTLYGNERELGASAATGQSDQTLSFDFGEIDFEAFGLSVTADETRTVWPPLPFTSRGASPLPYEGDSGVPLGSGLMGSGSGPSDLATWVAQQSANCSLPGAALGLGVGTFSGQNGLVITQDAFWQNILSSSAAPGMV